MSNTSLSLAIIGLIGLLPVWPVTTIHAAPQDYRFEIAQEQRVGAGKTDIAIRLVHAPDNQPVPDAAIFESKTDMGPSDMAKMAGTVTALPASRDGLYHFETHTGMKGKWALHLTARVKGETEPVRGTVDFDAK